MAKMEHVPLLEKVVMLANLNNGDEGNNATPLLTGLPGVGKTQIQKQTIKSINKDAILLTIEGGLLKEGEVGGIPFPYEGRLEYAPHPEILKIMELQKVYYDGLVDGSLTENRLVFNPEKMEFTYTNKKGEKEIYPVKFSLEEEAEIEREESKRNREILRAIKNGEAKEDVEKSLYMVPKSIKYNIMRGLPFEIKMEMLEKGWIKPVLLFFDEINRADDQTMKELMNVLLTKSINGFRLPWWVLISAARNPSSQDTDFATRIMDPAQLDRFVDIEVYGSLEGAIEYMTEKGNQSYEFLAALASMDMSKLKAKTFDSDEKTPTNRSFEQLGNIYNCLEKFESSSLFTNEEKKLLGQAFSDIAKAKIGATAGLQLIESMRNTETLLKPEEILDGTSDKVPTNAVRKFKAQKTLRRNITISALVSYIADHIDDIEKDKKSADEKTKKRALNKWGQLQNFLQEVMDDKSDRMIFGKKVLNLNGEDKSKSYKLFLKLASLLKPLLSELDEFDEAFKSLNK